MQSDEALNRQMRLAAIVIVAAVLLWFGGLFLGGALGLSPRFALLLDMGCMAAMIWSLVVLLRVRRARQARGS